MKSSLVEEIINSITHGIGALFSIVALTIMIIFAALYGTTEHIIAVAIYGGTLVLLYAMSTIYHALTNKRAKKVFKVLDHASVYLLIAGTYTPFALILLTNNSNLGWILLVIIWLLAIIGITFSSIFINKFRVVKTVLYIVMGWLIVFTLPDLIYNMEQISNIHGIYYLVAGGISYTVGAIIYLFKTKYSHAIWHLFVLLGSVLHFISVMFYLL
ncbi:MAG: hemolysin III family protein [Clostridia bacterium]